MTSDHYPYAPDEADINLMEKYESWTPDRIKKTINENEKLDYVGDNYDFLRNYTNVPLKQNRIDYDPYLEVAKISCGFRTTYKPDYTVKLDNWEARKPENEIAGQVVINNEYIDNPQTADDVNHSFPPYVEFMRNRLNITEENIELFSKKNIFLFFNKKLLRIPLETKNSI